MLQACPAAAAVARQERAPAQPSAQSSSSPARQTPARPSDSVERALKLAEANRWQAVVRVLSPVEQELAPAGILLLAEGFRRTDDSARWTATLRAGLARCPKDASLWLAWIDAALEQGAPALALERVADAERALGRCSPPLHYRAAQIYFQLGQALGKVAVREVPGGRAGQFVGEWLLAETRGAPDRFLCCPRESALYQLRRALDGGLNEPAAYLLHARIWQRAGRPEIGLAILQNREALLLEAAGPDELAVFAQLALEAGALRDFARYARLRAERQPDQRRDITAQAFLALAERYNERGETAVSTEFLRRAVELRPDDTALMLRLADAEWAAERHGQAARWYRMVLARQPTHAARARMLARLATWQGRAGKPP